LDTTFISLWLKTNHIQHKLVLAHFTKSTLEQQPTSNMGTLKNLKQTKKKGKKGGYENIPSMNHFGFMEVNDQVDFLYLGCFVALHKCNHNRHCIFQPFMFMLW
jgi:hypothetical protein